MNDDVLRKTVTLTDESGAAVKIRYGRFLDANELPEHVAEALSAMSDLAVPEMTISMEGSSASFPLPRTLNTDRASTYRAVLSLAGKIALLTAAAGADLAVQTAAGPVKVSVEFDVNDTDETTDEARAENEAPVAAASSRAASKMRKAF